jgi:threonine dehydratase
MFTLKELTRTVELVHQYIHPTPQYSWPQLCQSSGSEVWVKHENHTPITAFKVRGGINLVHGLMQRSVKPTGLISATRGNHGQSLAFAGSRFGLPVTIVVPECNSADQNRAIKAYGAELIVHGKDFEAARQHSLKLQQALGYQLVAPFERALVLGVATYAYEFMTTIEELDCIYVPVGMGSGISGLIKTRDLLGLQTQIIGVVSEGAPAFARSFEAGRIITTDQADTIADGIATRAPMEEAFEIIKQGAARIVTVSDQQITAAMYQYYQTTHNLVEGAGGAPLAALNKEKKQMKGKKVGLILTGGNIDYDRFIEYVNNFDCCHQ